MQGAIPKGMEILAEIKPGYEEILSKCGRLYPGGWGRWVAGRAGLTRMRRRAHAPTTRRGRLRTHLLSA